MGHAADEHAHVALLYGYVLAYSELIGSIFEYMIIAGFPFLSLWITSTI